MYISYIDDVLPIVRYIDAVTSTTFRQWSRCTSLSQARRTIPAMYASARRSCTSWLVSSEPPTPCPPAPPHSPNSDRHIIHSPGLARPGPGSAGPDAPTKNWQGAASPSTAPAPPARRLGPRRLALAWALAAQPPPPPPPPPRGSGRRQERPADAGAASRATTASAPRLAT
jgi:hypothetical protein